MVKPRQKAVISCRVRECLLFLVNTSSFGAKIGGFASKPDYFTPRTTNLFVGSTLSRCPDEQNAQSGSRRLPRPPSSPLARLHVGSKF